MKTDGHELTSLPAAEISERRPEKKDSPHKSNQEIKDEAYAFFHNMSQRYWIHKPQEGEKTIEERFLAEVKEMDVNTAQMPMTVYESKDPALSKEELQQIMEDDPGYVNGRVLDYDNESGSDENTYRETGFHTGAIHWGEYATKEGVEYVTLEEGKRLSRYGDEDGTFMSDTDVAYDSLELPIVKEKNVQSLYEVQKPFPVEISKVAKQPWNISDETKNNTETESVTQYKTPMPVSVLVKNGYLKRLDIHS